MRVKMLKEEPGMDLLPGARFEVGTEYEVPDRVGSKWVRRGIAAAVEVVVNSNIPKRGPRRPTTEE